MFPYMRLRPSERFVTLLAIFVLVTVGRSIVVGLYAESVPFWDQWDSEGLLLIKPWLEGTLTVEALFAPHNEHRIAWSRILFLALFEANGRQWDNLVATYANTAIHGLIDAFLYAQLTRGLASRPIRLTMAAAIVVLGCLPFGWENTVVGFQSAFFLMVGFAVLALSIAVHGPDRLLTLIGTVAVAALGLWTTASGLLAALAAAGVLLLRAWQGSMRRPLAALGAVALLAIALLAYRQVPVLAYHQGLKAAGFLSWLNALVATLSWPLSAGVFGVGFIWLPTIWYAASWRRVKESSGSDLMALALGSWVLLQAAAIAYSRGNGMTEPASRYADVLAIGLVANLWFAVRSFRLREVQVHRFAGGSVAVWLVFVLGAGGGLAIHTPRDLVELRSRQYLAVWQTYNVRAFVADHNAGHLQAPPQHIPYPDPARLAILLSDPTLRKVLPATIREPLAISGQGEGAFFGKLAANDILTDSCAPARRCSEGVGRWSSNELSSDFDFIRIPVFSGTRERRSTNVALCSVARPSDCSSAEGGELAVARVPRGQFRLTAADDSKTSWIALGRPVEINTLSLVARKLRAWTLRHIPHEPSTASPPNQDIELPHSNNDSRPMKLVSPRNVTALHIPKSGLVDGISVFVRAKGRDRKHPLRAEICRGTLCIQSRATYVSRATDAFALFGFPEPMLVERDSTLSMRLLTAHEKPSVAIWTAIPVPGSALLTTDNEVPRAPRIRLHFL